MKHSVKKIKEKDIGILESFCAVTAVLAGILCVLYLLDVLQNQWFLNFILGLGALLHVSLALLTFIRQKKIAMGLSALLTVFYIACLIYFNI